MTNTPPSREEQLLHLTAQLTHLEWELEHFNTIISSADGDRLARASQAFWSTADRIRLIEQRIANLEAEGVSS